MAWPSQRPLATPRPDSAETTVVSMANCLPHQKGRPFAMTSILRWSVTGTTMFKSRSNWFSFTRAPASRQMRATQISAGVPRGFSRPTREQADLLWPNTSNRAQHLLNRSSTWRGKCNWTRSNVRNSSAVKVVS